MEIEKVEFGTMTDFNAYEKLSMASELLRENLCEVVFTKLDGSLRTMRCTIDSKRIGGETPAPVERQRDPNKPLVMSVYLPEEACWRSFRLDNLISVEVVA